MLLGAVESKEWWLREVAAKIGFRRALATFVRYNWTLEGWLILCDFRAPSLLL